MAVYGDPRRAIVGIWHGAVGSGPFIGSGAFISPRWVLTAGHVVDGEKYPNGFFLGLTELGLSVSVSDIIIHPDLDIALIGLETESADQGLVRFSIESTALTGKRVDFYGVNRLSNAREAQKNHTVGSWHPELGGYLCDHRILKGFSGGIAVVGGFAIGVITQRHETEQQTLVVPLHRADSWFQEILSDQKVLPPESAINIERPEWAAASGRDDYGLYADFEILTVRQRMRWIAPGMFLMGSPADEPERSGDETPHLVSLTEGYWLADTACTQALWRAVMGTNPSPFKGDERPVDSVSWEDAQIFIKRLNATPLGNAFRLPTEAEWEYACRAGTTGPFWFGDQVTTDQVNFDGNYPYAGGAKGQYRQETVNVKDLPCNGWGLYQMHGNVWEWCQDWFADYDPDTVKDPVGPAKGSLRVLRGGGWISDGRGARSAGRLASDPADRGRGCGFRLARGQASGHLAPEAH